MISRREALHLLAGTGVALATPTGLAASLRTAPSIEKVIPSTGLQIPNVGLGSWITFNVGDDPEGLASSAEVIRAFFAAGGRQIDSSPMYGSSQNTIGRALAQMDESDVLFSADKIWTSGTTNATRQLAETQQRWGVNRFSLLQVHNLRDWRTHLPLLLDMRKRGQLGHVGVTTSHGRRHQELLQIIENQAIDFIQLTYNMADREPEERLLSAAALNRVAVICNRPFDGGRLVRRLKQKPFPAWASDAGFAGWPDFLLKYITGHPAVTCAIPATTSIVHLRENMAAVRGELPDQAMRARMLQTYEAL